MYIFRAAYKDQGANGLPSVASEETFILRNPSINPTKYDEFSNVNKMSFGGNSFVIASKHGSYIGLKQIDLAGVNEVELMAVAPKAQLNAEGGTIELHIDSIAGKLLGKSEFIGDIPGSGFKPNPVTIKVEPVKGVHDVYFVFQNPAAVSGRSLMIVMNTMFKTGEMIKNQGTMSLPAADHNAYTGKYKMTGLPFPYIEISVKDDKLIMDAGGQISEIKPTEEQDLFDADGKATLTFIRNGEKKVDKLKMNAMGFTFDGTKE